MTTHSVMWEKHGFYTGFLLARSIFSLNIASNTSRVNAAKKTFWTKLRVKVGTKYDGMYCVFSQKRRWIALSAGQDLSGRGGIKSTVKQCDQQRAAQL